jgi:hypothetical protein
LAQAEKVGNSRVCTGAGASTLGASTGGGGENVVITAEIVEGSDEPAKLLATTVNLYVVDESKPVTSIVPEDERKTVALMPLGNEVAVYEVIGEPPSNAGAV